MALFIDEEVFELIPLDEGIISDTVVIVDVDVDVEMGSDMGAEVDVDECIKLGHNSGDISTGLFEFVNDKLNIYNFYNIFSYTFLMLYNSLKWIEEINAQFIRYFSNI